jgi:hypothetical protein
METNPITEPTTMPFKSMMSPCRNFSKSSTDTTEKHPDLSVVTSRRRSTGLSTYRFNLLAQTLKKLFISYVGDSHKFKPICECSGKLSECLYGCGIILHLRSSA